MPDDKYEICGIESMRQAESRLHRYQLNRPVYTATLEDMQRQIRTAMCAPDWMLKPKEVRPQDMAIWRAILAGDEWFAPLLFCTRPALMRSHYLKEQRPGGFHIYRSNTLEEVRPRFPAGTKFARFVLFTHPFAGGRAVFSEPVD